MFQIMYQARLLLSMAFSSAPWEHQRHPDVNAQQESSQNMSMVFAEVSTAFKWICRCV